MREHDAHLQNKIYLSGIAFLLVLLVTVLFVLPYFSMVTVATVPSFYASRLLLWLCLILMVLYAKYLEQKPLLLWPEKSYTLPAYGLAIAKIMATLFAAVFLFSTVFNLIYPQTANEKLDSMMPLFKNNIPLIVITCLTAGVVEEFLFRGYLLPRLTILTKKRYVAVVLSSIIFGLLHIGYGTLIQVLGPFIIALVLALKYQKYQNIKMVIVCHFLWDLIVLYIKLR